MKKIRLFVGLSCLLSVVLPHVQANPNGGVVVGGNANATITGTTLDPLVTIQQAADRAIIDWAAFSIDKGQRTLFQFNGAAGANSLVLNRVVGTGGVIPASTIYGRLESTVGAGGAFGGTVYLINPSGLLIGPSGRINVGSFVGSTLDLGPDAATANANFLAGGPLTFEGGSTKGIAIQSDLTERGQIKASQDIFLIAHTIENAGELNADRTVGLAAGVKVELKQYDAGNPLAERISVMAGQNGTGAAAGVKNSAADATLETQAGVISATVSELKAAGGNIYALAINNGGAIRATHLVNENGRVFLRASDPANQGGKIAQTGTIERGGAVKNTGLETTGSEFNGGGGTTTLGSGSVNLNQSGTVVLGRMDLGGDLAVSAGGKISQQGPVTVAGHTVLSADNGGTPQDITLNRANDFNTLAVLKGQNVSITDRNTVELSASAISGAFKVTAGDSITQSGALKVDGPSEFVAGKVDLINYHTENNHLVFEWIGNARLEAVDTLGGSWTELTPASSPYYYPMAGPFKFFRLVDQGQSGAVMLGNPDNVFGPISVGGKVRDVNLANKAPAALFPDLLTSLENLEINFSQAAVDLPALKLGGNLTITAGGPITQKGAVEAGQAAQFESKGAGHLGNITLGEANHFGIVKLTSNNGNQVTLNENSDTRLDDVNVDKGSLKVTSAGVIDQVAGKGILVDKLADFESKGNGDAGTIKLEGNNYFGSVKLTSLNGNQVTVNENSGTLLEDVLVDKGALKVTSTGVISQESGKQVTVSQLAEFESTGTGDSGNISLTEQNYFGSLKLTSLNGNQVTVNENSATRLDEVLVDKGALKVTSTGVISQEGKQVTVGGLAEFESTGTGDSGNISLTGQNYFGSLKLTSLNGNQVTVDENSATRLDEVLVDKGALKVTSTGLISQEGGKSVTVGGLAEFGSAGTGDSGDISLTEQNYFGSLKLTSLNGNQVTVNENSATRLDEVLVDKGALKLASTGVISQESGKKVTVGGLAEFESTGSGDSGNIVLDMANSFGSVRLTSQQGNEVRLDEANSTKLEAVQVGAGALHVTSKEGIAQETGQSISVGNQAEFTAGYNGAAGDIVLQGDNNYFGSLKVVAQSGSAQLHEADASTLDSVDVKSLFDLHSGGRISQSGTLQVGGKAGFNAIGNGAAGNIDLRGNNHFGSLQLISDLGKKVQVNEADDTQLEQIRIAKGDLELSSVGSINQLGGQAATVGGQAAVSSSGAGAKGNILMEQANNNFGSLQMNSPGGSQVSIREASDSQLAEIAVNSGSFKLSSAGKVEQAGGKAANVGGLAEFGSSGFGSAGDIQLAQANQFGAVKIDAINSSKVVVNEIDGTMLDDVRTGSQFEMISGGSIDQAAYKGITAIGDVSLTAPAGQSIRLGSTLPTSTTKTLNNGQESLPVAYVKPLNTFGGQVIFNASGSGNLQDVVLVDSSAITLGGLDVKGAAVITSELDIKQTAPIHASQLKVTSWTGKIELLNSDNTIQSAQQDFQNGNLALADQFSVFDSVSGKTYTEGGKLDLGTVARKVSAQIVPQYKLQAPDPNAFEMSGEKVDVFGYVLRSADVFGKEYVTRSTEVFGNENIGK